MWKPEAKTSGRFILENMNYVYHTYMSLANKALMSLYFGSLLSYSFYYLVKWNKKVKGYNNIKSCKPLWNSKCWVFYICRWIYILPKIYATLKTKLNKYDNYN